MEKRLPIVGAVILAGGKRALDEANHPGRPKLLEDVDGLPVLHHVINAVLNMRQVKGQSAVTVVISTRYEEVLREALFPYPDINVAVQDKHLGTADAVWQAIEQGKFPDCDHLFVLMGDQPLVTSKDLDLFYNQFISHPVQPAAILAFEEERWRPEFRKCAKVLFDDRKQFLELKTRLPISEGDPAELLHAGPYLFDAHCLRGALSMVSDFVTYEREFHLYTPLKGARDSYGVKVCTTNSPEHFLGVDTRTALEEVRKRIAERDS